MKHCYYSENDLVRDVNDIAEFLHREGVHVGNIYGIPRGGRIPAAVLSSILQIPTTQEVTGEETLIIDDIVDSGATREKYKDNFFVSLHCKKHASTPPDYTCNFDVQEWIHYFWEDTLATAGQELVTRILELIGENPNRHGLVETPARVVRSWQELFAGYNGNPLQILKGGFEENGYPLDGIIYLREIEFFSTCEHHMLPFYGKAHVGYIPKDGKVVGISKLARLVDCFARRLQIQERIANQVVDALMEFGVLGAICIIEAKHLCIACRGVGKQHSLMGCSALRGVFMTNQEARTEAISLLLGK